MSAQKLILLFILIILILNFNTTYAFVESKNYTYIVVEQQSKKNLTVQSYGKTSAKLEQYPISSLEIENIGKRFLESIFDRDYINKHFNLTKMKYDPVIDSIILSYNYTVSLGEETYSIPMYLIIKNKTKSYKPHNLLK